MLAASPGSQHLDVIASINSGQTFLWQNFGNSWYGIDGNRLLKIGIIEDGLEYSSFPEHQSWERELFRLDDDIYGMHASLSKDDVLAPIIKKYPGLRLLRQDPEQCMFSFVCASNTNIPMIRRMLQNLSKKFGRKITCDGHQFFTFPSASALGAASVDDLRSCGLGYRAKAVKSAADMIVRRGIDLYELRRKADYLEARNQLLQIYGIGNKIADCIMLFSLDKLDAFPIDVWIARALYKNYSDIFEGIREKLTAHQYESISEKIRVHFGKYAGYAQQYLYYDMRRDAGAKW